VAAVMVKLDRLWYVILTVQFGPKSPTSPLKVNGQSEVAADQLYVLIRTRPVKKWFRPRLPIDALVIEDDAISSNAPIENHQ
jgi:hypothetical protein